MQLEDDNSRLRAEVQQFRQRDDSARALVTAATSEAQRLAKDVQRLTEAQIQSEADNTVRWCVFTDARCQRRSLSTGSDLADLWCVECAHSQRCT